MKPLNRLFGQPEIDRRIVTIKKRIDAGRYLCADREGRLFPATTTNSYPLGAIVFVAAGQITGSAGTIQTFEV